MTITDGSPFTPDDFASRRTRLAESLDDGAIILAAGHLATRNHDVEYEFRQDSTFWYFTGLDEPDAVAVLRPGADAPYVLFVNSFDPKYEIWVGERVGVEGAKETLGADEAFTVEELDEKLPELLAETGTVYYALGSGPAARPSRYRPDRQASFKRPARRQLRQSYSRPGSGGRVDEGRQVRQRGPVPPEGDRHHRAGFRPRDSCDPTRSAGVPRPDGVGERVPSSGVSAERLPRPSSRQARTRASCHYIKNRGEIRDGDLLLIDAGAEVDYYGADITRTWPANGRFTPEQRVVYDIVLAAQKEAITVIAPGVEFAEVHKTARDVLIQGLLDLGVLDGDMDDIIEEREYEPYYMHGTSHWLGLDVHDAGVYKNGEDSVVLQEGMVFTVEPGLYFGSQAEDRAGTPQGHRHPHRGRRGCHG